MNNFVRKNAELQHQLLSDREDGPCEGLPRRKLTVPGGNPNLPVSDVLHAPSGAGFWEEDMVAYILSILDETVTNGYRIDGVELTLLSDDTPLAQQRRTYAKMALIQQGAIEVT